MAAALVKLDRWLRQRPLGLALFLAAIVAYAVSSDDIVSEDVLPFGDGERYAMRCFSLYGFLHTGQWAQFWDLFTLPKQSLLQPHHLLFFLLPQGLASLTSYGVLQAVTTYGLLALGAWQLCRVLGRAEWAPALLLLCAINNISIDFSYFYFADMPFTAVGMLVLAWQMAAWRQPDLRRSLLSGAGLGLLYWIKAPNALIFTATFLIAEIARLFLSHERKPAIIARHIVWGLCGFVPVTGLALASGGFNSIIRQINENEVSDIFITKLECTGLLRFFYFPLCLSYFYHAIVMAVVFALAVLAAVWLNRKPDTDEASPSGFPWRLFLPLIIAYLVLGEFYSFGEASKGIRSLLLVLPVMWLCLFALLEKIRVRAALVFIAAAAYCICAFAQIFSNAFGTVDLPTEGYQLKDDWLGRMPQPHYYVNTHLNGTTEIVKMLRATLPDGGKIAIGTERIYYTSESLNWVMQHDAVLRGQRQPYTFENFIAEKGGIERRALVGANAAILYIQLELQYSRAVLRVSNDIIQYGNKTWPKDGSFQMIPMRLKGGGIGGCYILARQPFTDAQVSDLIKGANATELPPDIELNPPIDHHLTWSECRDILLQWERKRLGD